jgi:hypothetical protein
MQAATSSRWIFGEMKRIFDPDCILAPGRLAPGRLAPRGLGMGGPSHV